MPSRPPHLAPLHHCYPHTPPPCLATSHHTWVLDSGILDHRRDASVAAKALAARILCGVAKRAAGILCQDAVVHIILRGRRGEGGGEVKGRGGRGLG